MAEITISTKASVDAVMAQKSLILSELKAGATISKGKAVYLASDGLVKLADKDVVNSRTIETGLVDFVEDISQFLGFSNGAYVSGDPITVFGFGNVISDYSTGMTPGAYLWMSDAGVLSDAAIATGDAPVALCLSATDILVVR